MIDPPVTTRDRVFVVVGLAIVGCMIVSFALVFLSFIGKIQ